MRLADEVKANAEREKRFREEIARLESALDGSQQGSVALTEKHAAEIAALKAVRAFVTLLFVKDRVVLIVVHV